MSRRKILSFVLLLLCCIGNAQTQVQTGNAANSYAPLFWTDGFEYAKDINRETSLNQRLNELYAKGWRGVHYWGATREGDKMNYYFTSPFLRTQSWAKFGGDGLTPLVKAAHAKGMQVMINIEDVNPYHWSQHHWSATSIERVANDLATTGMDGLFEECFEADPAVFTSLANTLKSRNVAYVSGTDPMLLREPYFTNLWERTGIINVYNYYLKRDKLYNIATLAQNGSLALGWAKYWNKPTSMMSPVNRNWGIAEEHAPAVVSYIAMIRALQFRVDNFMILGGQNVIDPVALQSWIKKYTEKQTASRPTFNIVVLLDGGDKKKNNSSAWNNLFNEGDALTSGAFNAGYNVVVSDKPIAADAYWIYAEGGNSDTLSGEVAGLFRSGKKVFIQTANGLPSGNNIHHNWSEVLHQCGINANVPFKYAGGRDVAPDASLPESQEEDVPYTGYYQKKYLRITNDDTQRGDNLRAGTIIPVNAITGHIYCEPNATYGRGPFVVGRENKFAITNASLNWEAAYMISDLLAKSGAVPTSNVWGIAGSDVSAFLAIETTELELTIPQLEEGAPIHVVVWDKNHAKKAEENVIYHTPFKRFLNEYDFILIDVAK